MNVRNKWMVDRMGDSYCVKVRQLATGLVQDCGTSNPGTTIDEVLTWILSQQGTRYYDMIVIDHQYVLSLMPVVENA